MFRPAMTAFTRDIRAIAAVDVVAAGGLVADLWQAEGRAGGGGHYLSPDPRMVMFIGAGPVGMAAAPDGPATARLAFIPAGVPVWTRVQASGRFRHLDLHLGPQAIAAIRACGGDLPAAAILLDACPLIDSLAAVIADDIAAGGGGPPVLTPLAAALLAGFCRAAPSPGPRRAGGLTPTQYRRVTDVMQKNLDRSLPVAELAAAVGLSESWFSRAFRVTTGQTPARALTAARIAAAQTLLTDLSLPLADIAAATGFADQAHFTRAFRAATGTTPAVWRTARPG